MNTKTISNKLANISASTAQAVVVTKFTDPTEVSAGSDGIEVIGQDIMSLTSTPFSAKRVIMRLNGSVILFQQTSHKLRSNTKVQPGLMAFTATGPQAMGTLDGRKLHPGTLFAACPGAESQLVVNPGYSSITFFIPP